MFTAEQLKQAHARVRSGADFPAYIKEINGLGVTHYEAYVTDGHTDYHGADGFTVVLPAKYESVSVGDTVDLPGFKTELKAHQQGKTDYPTFIRMCADKGIRLWRIDIRQMTCIYYDNAGQEVLAETIPG